MFKKKFSQTVGRKGGGGPSVRLKDFSHKIQLSTKDSCKIEHYG